MNIPQPKRKPELDLDYERIVRDAIQAHQPVADTGVAVAVLRYGELAYAGGFGFRNRKTREPVDANTLFAIGSATKAFTSTVLSILAETGAFSLDEPIRQIVPSFKTADPRTSRDATLIDILSQHTGLAPHNSLWYLGPFTRAQLFFRLRYLQFAAPFRTAYVYNNLMYMVAGHLLEIKLGLSYEEIIKAHILDPLGMTETNLSFAKLRDNPNHALGYKGEEQLYLKDFANIGPAAEINSTALDMAKWVELFLQKGMAGNGKVVIGRDALARTYQPFTDPGDGTMYGLGWNIGKITTPSGPADARLIFHTGDPQGGSAYVSFMPEQGLGVVVLTNQHCTAALIDTWPDKVATEIYDHLLHDKQTGQLKLPPCLRHGRLSLITVHPTHPAPPPVAKAAALVEAAAPALASFAAAPALAIFAAAQPLAPAESQDYTGMFSNPGYGDFVVSRNGDKLFISYYGSSWELGQFGDTTFLFTVPAFGGSFPVLVEYSRDTAGDITGFDAQLVLQPRLMMIPFTKRQAVVAGGASVA